MKLTNEEFSPDVKVRDESGQEFPVKEVIVQQDAEGVYAICCVIAEKLKADPVINNATEGRIWIASESQGLKYSEMDEAR